MWCPVNAGAPPGSCACVWMRQIKIHYSAYRVQQPREAAQTAWRQLCMYTMAGTGALFAWARIMRRVESGWYAMCP